MRFVIDMNLTPEWASCLASAGHDAIHWSTIGSACAHDGEVMEWAGGNDRIVMTSDLDFGTMLALSGGQRPSVVQLRTESTLPARVGPIVLKAIERAEKQLLSGALLTIETARLRLRILPFRQDH